MYRNIPGLGSVQGLLSTEFKNSEQYRGIPYGSISARFRQSKLVTTWPEKRCDATKYGYDETKFQMQGRFRRWLIMS